MEIVQICFKLDKSKEVIKIMLNVFEEICENEFGLGQFSIDDVLVQVFYYFKKFISTSIRNIFICVQQLARYTFSSRLPSIQR